jgi:hypothetical protein
MAHQSYKLRKGHESGDPTLSSSHGSDWSLFIFHDPFLFPLLLQSILSIWHTSKDIHSRLLWNTKNHLPNNNMDQEMHFMIQLIILCLPFKEWKFRFRLPTVFFQGCTILHFTLRYEYAFTCLSTSTHSTRPECIILHIWICSKTLIRNAM